MAAGGPAGRAAAALGATLVALVALRALASALSGMTLWGVNLPRFLSPAMAWGPWLVAAMALVPAVGRTLERPVAAAGDGMARAPWIAAAVAAVLLVALVWVLPERVGFVGDFLLRLGTADNAMPPREVFPQALPLDVALHYHLPRWVAHGGLDTYAISRLVGAVEGALLAALAVGFARTLGLVGAPAVAAVALTALGGWLGLYNGYAKAFGELVLLTVATGVFGLRVVRHGTGWTALGVSVALALLVHRSALGLLPALALAIALGLRRHRPRDARGWAWVAGAIAPPLAALAAVGPKVLATLRGVDVSVHLAPPEVARAGGPLAAAFAGTRPADFASLAFGLAPLALAVPVLLVALGRALPRRSECALLGVLALPFVAIAPLLHPAQGLFRDWDDFAATAAAVALLAAWLVAETLRAAPRRAWIGTAAALVAAAATAQWLAVGSDLPRGLRRVEAFVTEPPRRTDAERGKTWDFLGIRDAQLQRWDQAAVAMAHAAETVPSPRVLLQWAMAEEMRGHLAESQRVFRRALAAHDDELGWAGLARVSLELGDAAEAARAAAALERLRPGSPQAAWVRAQVDSMEARRGAATR